VIESNGRKTHYQYDAFGNRTQKTITNDPTASGVYDYTYPTNSNRLQAIHYNGQVQETFLYDNSGRMTQRSRAGVVTLYTWNALGQLIGVNPKTGSTGPSVSYTYDGLGVRKSKTVDGTTTHYLTANLFGYSHVLAELDSNLNIQATYVYAGNSLLKEEPVANDRNQDLYLLSSGTVGSITHATDINGQIKNQYNYDAFGTRTDVSANSSSHKHYGYTGEETDAETGLIYLRARYYDPESPRVCRRLHNLRGWSDEQKNEIFPGSPGTGGPTIIGSPRRAWF